MKKMKVQMKKYQIEIKLQKNQLIKENHIINLIKINILKLN